MVGVVLYDIFKKPCLIFKQLSEKKSCNGNYEVAELLLPSSATDVMLNLISYIYMGKKNYFHWDL